MFNYLVDGFYTIEKLFSFIDSKFRSFGEDLLTSTVKDVYYIYKDVATRYIKLYSRIKFGDILDEVSSDKKVLDWVQTKKQELEAKLNASGTSREDKELYSDIISALDELISILK